MKAQGAIFCILLAVLSQLDMTAAGTNSLGGIRTNFVSDAILNPAELAAVVGLAKSCGMDQVARVETFHYLPSLSRGISVISVERTNGRKVTFDRVEVFREGWAYSQPAGPVPVKSDGEFWVRPMKSVTVHTLTTFVTSNGTIRVNLSPRIPIGMADKVVKAFATGRIKYSDQFTESLSKGANFSRPNWLGRAEKSNHYEISFSGSLNHYEFVLEGDDVRILVIHHINV